MRASPRRILRILLLATAASTATGIWYALTNRSSFQVAFPGAAEARVYAGLLVTGAGGLVAMAGLWWWQRWALVLYGAVVVSSLGLDVAASAPTAHQLTVLVGAIAIFSLTYANRQQFGWS